MATEYVNPEFTGTSTGSITQPWKSGNDATPANNLELLWKRDIETPDVLTQIEINALDNVTLGYYGSGAKPILQCYSTFTDRNDWSDLGNDVWSISLPTGQKGDCEIFGLGSLPTDLRDHTQWQYRAAYTLRGVGEFTEYGQHDTLAGNPATLYIYAPQNPIDEWGTIYWGANRSHNVFSITGQSSNILIDGLNIQNAHAPSWSRGTTGLRNSDITMQNCLIEHCSVGIKVSEYNDNLIQQDNEIYTSGHLGILLSGVLEGIGNKAIRNVITDSGGSWQGAGIFGTVYGALATDKLIVAENTVNRCWEGIYYLGVEAHGIYLERACEYVSVRGNTVKNLRDSSNASAYHTNGGKVGCDYTSNKSINCKTGLTSSDAFPTNSDDFSILFNHFAEVDNAFSFVRQDAADTVDIKLYGNVATANPDKSGSNGVLLDVEFDDLLTALDNDNNWLYGFDTNIDRVGAGTLQHSLGSETVTNVDPLLNASTGEFASNSPVRRSGAASLYSSVIDTEKIDARGRTKLKPFDIGAHGFNARYKSPIGLPPR